jgi:Protein of unknown function (DUF1236)
MKLNWVYTTAIALFIGAGAAIAQSPDASQKRGEGPRAQSPAAQSKEMDRPAAGDRMKEHAAQPEQKGQSKEVQRGEGALSGERSKQAQEPQGRESREPTRQSQEQGRERSPAGTAQQEEQKGRDARQTTEQQRTREGQKDERAQDTKRPSDMKQTTEQQRSREGQKDEQAQGAKTPAETKQQQSQQERDRRDETKQQQSQQQRERRDQAAQPSGTSTQQTARPGESGQEQRQGQRTGEATDQSNRRAANVNDDQRREVVDRLRREGTARNENVNIRVNVGERLPPRVEAERLPPDIVRIVPQYRDYEYTVIDNRVAIVDPRSREIVDFFDESGPGYGSASYSGGSRGRVVISDDTRTRLRELARRSSTTVGSTASSGGGSGPTCLSLQPVPDELARNHPELSSYSYLAIGDEVVLVDPQQQKVVQVID